ncbi:MAG: hypothetical protein ACPLX8_00010 [Nanopusillaceae archaeon]
MALDIRELLSQYGFFDFILPFLLIFSLVYMILELSGLLKVSPDDPVGRKLSILFSFSFALLSMANINLVIWLLKFIPNASFAVLAFFLLAVIIAAFGRHVPGPARAILGLIVVGIMIWLAVNAMNEANVNFGFVGLFGYIIDFLIQSGLLTLIIIFLLLFLIVYWVTSPGQSGGDHSRSR